jgi:Ca2+-binding RTX toxin-like protein
VDGGTGNDTLNGGLGIDTASYASAASAVTVSLALTSAQATGGSGTDTLTGFENLTGSAYNDILIGAAGANTLAGGKGDDTYYVQDTTDIVTEAVGEGTDTVHSSVTFTLGANVENLTLTGTAAINGTGNALNNLIIANAGNNVLAGDTGIDTVSYAAATAGVTVSLAVTTAQTTGGSGTDTLTGFENLTGSAFNDTLTGSSAANVLTGGRGDDVYVIQTAGDSIIELADEGFDTIQSSVTHTLSAHVENLTLTGSNAVNGTGNGLANILTGNSAANTLAGGGGNDTYIIQNSTDIVTENLNEGVDTVQSSVTHTLSANLENLTLTGTSAINGTGNALDNILTGNAANNTLTGGAGLDQFIFNTALNGTTNVDTVSDFSVADDTIVLENAIFTAFGATGGISTGNFLIGTAAADADDFLIYNATTRDGSTVSDSAVSGISA